MELFSLKKEFAEKNILICFNGPFTHSILEEIGLAIRNHLNQENLTKAAVSDVFSVYIELTQNARNYIQARNFQDEELKSTIVVVAKDGERYAVTAGNYMVRNDLPPLLDRIQTINQRTPEELKKMYKEQLRNGTPEKGNSAGLGLIDIARKSTEKLETNVREVSNEISFFSISAFV